jgi:hypothetical protein
VALGGGWLERGADLCVSEIVRLAALAGVVAAGTKGVVMECSGDLSVVELERFGWRDGVEGESAEKRSVLKHRLSEMGREGSEEWGVTIFEDFGTSGGVFVDMRKRSEDSIAAVLAWGATSLKERMPRPPRRVGREMIWASVGMERGDFSRDSRLSPNIGLDLRRWLRFLVRRRRGRELPSFLSFLYLFFLSLIRSSSSSSSTLPYRHQQM